MNNDPLFFHSWLSAPFRIGALQPSSEELCAAVATHVNISQPGAIVELGSGTGVIARALIARGVPPEQLYLIELTPQFCNALRIQLPGTNVLEGDITERLAHLAATPGFGPVSTVISSLPIIFFEFEQQRSIIQHCFDLMGSIGRFLQVSHLPISPLPRKTRSAWIQNDTSVAKLFACHSLDLRKSVTLARVRHRIR